MTVTDRGRQRERGVREVGGKKGRVGGKRGGVGGRGARRGGGGGATRPFF